MGAARSLHDRAPGEGRSCGIEEGKKPHGYSQTNFEQFTVRSEAKHRPRNSYLPLHGGGQEQSAGRCKQRSAVEQGSLHSRTVTHLRHEASLEHSRQRLEGKEGVGTHHAFVEPLGQRRGLQGTGICTLLGPCFKTPSRGQY